jgi:hypothetical protein
VFPRVAAYLIKAKVIRATKIGKWRIKPSDISEFVSNRTNINIKPN